MQQVLGCSVNYRIAIGPPQKRIMFTLQTIPSWEENERFAQVVKRASCCPVSMYNRVTTSPSAKHSAR